FVFCFVSLFVSLASSQDASTGAIRGSVLAPGGLKIPNATVVLVNAANGFRRVALTDGDGPYVADLLLPRECTARAEAQGMSPEVAKHVRVELGATVALDFHLSVAGAKETVTVTGDVPMVETQPSAVSSVVEERAIQDLPLNGQRFTDLALLTPGVT